MSEFTLNVPEFQGIAEDFLEDFTDEVKEEIDANTPEKTGSLVKSIKKSKIRKDGTNYSQDVFIDEADLDYDPNLVEDGVGGRIFTYNKPAGQPRWKGDGKGGSGRHMVGNTFKAFQKTLGQNKT